MGCFSNCGSNSCWIIILLLLFCGGGCGNTFSNDGCGCGNNSGFFGGNDCGCIWIILLLLFCGGGCGNNSGFVTANNNSCGCNSCNTCNTCNTCC